MYRRLILDGGRVTEIWSLSMGSMFSARDHTRFCRAIGTAACDPSDLSCPVVYPAVSTVRVA